MTEFFSEHALTIWQEQIKNLYHESIAVAIGVFSIQGDLLYTNAGMKILLGVEDQTHAPTDYLVNPNFKSLIHRSINNGPIFEGLLTTGNGIDVMRTVRAKVYHLNDYLLIVGEYDVMEFDHMNNQMAALNQELTNLQRELIKKKTVLERTLNELKETQAMLFHAEKMNALGQLVAGIIHEINNPLAFVTSNLYSLKDSFEDIVKAYTELEQLTENADAQERQTVTRDIREKYDLDFIFEDFEHLHKGSSDGLLRVQKLIQALRTFSRLDESELKKIDLAQTITSTLSLVEPELKKHHINIELSLDNLPPVQCYASELNQVFLNLMINAAQAMEDGGTLGIKGREEDGTIRLEFADTGVGIPPDIINNIFDPFFTTKPIGTGTGLGLSLADRIITNKHQGSLRVDSQVNVGTVFTIILPVEGR